MRLAARLTRPLEQRTIGSDHLSGLVINVRDACPRRLARAFL
jgi:hypothetical protein